MTDDQLATIEARVLATTPGPWFPVVTDDELFQGAVYVGLDARGEERGGMWMVDNPKARLMEDQVDPDRIVAITCLQFPMLACPVECDENALFIAHARDDVLALVAEVRALKRLLEQPG